jgi:hypothetical protein
MNTPRTSTRNAIRPAAAAVALTLALAGCSSSPLPAPPGGDRHDPRVVADAFATAWAGGDLAVACGLTAGPEKDKLTSKSQCTGHAGWVSQTPRAVQSCTFPNGSLAVLYQVDQEVDRFLIFAPGVEKQPDGTFAVTSLPEHDPGEPLDAVCHGATKVVNSG